MARWSPGERYIEQFFPDYSSFIARLNASASQASISSQASHVSQVAPENALNFESSPELLKHQKQIREWIRKNVEVIVKAFPPNSDLTPRSTDRSSKDSSIYVGCGGNAYLHWRLARYFQQEEEEEMAVVHKKYAVTAIEVALSLLPAQVAGGSEIAFYIGSAGVYSLAAVIYWMAGHLSKTEAQIYKVLDLLPSCLHDTAPDELLFGRAGYLFCLLFMKKNLPKEVVDRLQLSKTARKVFETLIEQGKRQSGTSNPQKGVLKYFFHGTDYLGAAHGTAGILYMLLQFPDWCRDPANKSWIINTMDYIMGLQSEDGNFPVKLSDQEYHLYHWCHGAPGIVYTLYHAHKVLAVDKSILRCLDSALKATWEKGLLRKGFGVCHGIAGSGYCFLMMHRHTGADEYLYTAYKMAEAIRSDEVKKEVMVYADPQRRRLGVPDFPYSLMEGLGGTICFYCDLLHPKTAAFPGYDGDTATMP